MKTYKEIKKEINNLCEEYNNAVTYETRYKNKVVYTGWNEGYETDEKVSYLEKVADEEKRAEIKAKIEKLASLPEYIEGKEAENKKSEERNNRYKAKRYRKELEELNERKAYLEKWLTEYEAKEEA